MKSRWILTVLAALCLTAVAQAQERPWYVGVKIGLVSLDGSALLNAGAFDDLEVGGVLFGYKLLTRDWGSIAIEAEYATSLSEADAVNGLLVRQWEGETWAGYLAYRGPRKVYFKGKLGYLDASAELTVPLPCLVPPCPRVLIDDADVSAGIGVGWRVGSKWSLELEWTRTFFDHDLDSFSLGFIF